MADWLAHLLGRDPAALQRALDAHDDAAAVGLGLGHVVGIAGHRTAHKFGEDGGAPGPRVLQLLQHQHACGRRWHKRVTAENRQGVQTG